MTECLRKPGSIGTANLVWKGMILTRGYCEDKFVAVWSGIDNEASNVSVKISDRKTRRRSTGSRVFDVFSYRATCAPEDGMPRTRRAVVMVDQESGKIHRSIAVPETLRCHHGYIHLQTNGRFAFGGSGTRLKCWWSCNE